jgi:hypothetical protein
MKRFLSMKRLSIMFVSLFGLSTAGMLIHQHFWIDPAERCEKSGRWYYAADRSCVTPIYIPEITGRAPGQSRAEASAARNREVVELEAEAARQKAALAAEVRRQREAALAARPGA